MKLTKAEKEALQKNIVNDLPEGFAIFSPWMSLWLSNTILLLICISIIIGFSIESFGLSPSKILISGVLLIFFICVANFYLLQGYNLIGIKLLKYIAIAYVVISLFLMLLSFYFGKNLLFPIVAIVLSLVSLLIVCSARFQVFALHRKKVMDWGRERIKKNQDFTDRIKENRRRSGQKY